LPDDARHSAQSPAKTRVFLSYSRKDDAFTRRLAVALETRGYAPDFDQSRRDDPTNFDTGISVEDDWWDRLKDMIVAADVMVFIVSPDSAASPVCDKEIAYARNMGKRIIAILRRPVDFSKLPPLLSARHIELDFTDDAEVPFAAAVDRLSSALDLDVAWHRESARLTLLAQRWDKAGRTEELLLTAADVRAVGDLLERRPVSAPEPSEVLVALRDASRARMDAEETRQRRIIGRAFVKPTEEALKAGQAEHALRLCAAGALLAKDLGFDPRIGTQLSGPAAHAVFENRTCTVLKGHASAVTAATFSPDGTRVVTASYDRTARLWDATTGEQIATLKGHAAGVMDASFSPDGARIVTASRDKTTRIWDATTGESIATLKGHTDWVLGATFSPDGRQVVTASWDETERIWDSETGTQITVLGGHTGAAEGHTGGVHSATFSPDGRRIVTASDHMIARVFDAATGKQIVALEGHDDGIESARFSPDAVRIVTASRDFTACIWDAATGKKVATLEGHASSLRSAAFSADGARIVTASDDNTARIWDAATARQITTLAAHTSNVNSAAFSPDGRQIVTASDDNTARIWQATPGKQVAVLRGHTSCEASRGCSWSSRDG
jgi:WD40 repeat protein